MNINSNTIVFDLPQQFMFQLVFNISITKVEAEYRVINFFLE